MDSKIMRSDLVNFLENRGIETRYLMPLNNQPFYVKMFGNIEVEYPVAKQTNRNGFIVDSHQDLTRNDLNYIVEAFENFFASKALL